MFNNKPLDAIQVFDQLIMYVFSQCGLSLKP
jgi:hypothetical protein